MIPQFLSAMEQDLNTPAALAALFGLVREINSLLDSPNNGKRLDQLRGLYISLLSTAQVLGILNSTPQEFFLSLRSDQAQMEEREIELLIEERSAARKAKDYKRADQIRDLLKSKGVILQDTPEGTTWRWDLG